MPDILQRCPWVDLKKADYIAYHDQEWGLPVYDDQLLFEFLILEGAQAGLSWYTILKRRENYRKAFANFDPKEVAVFDESKVQELLANPGIIRNQLKIRAAINNASRFLDVKTQFGSFSDYIWRFVDGQPMVHKMKKLQDYPTSTPEAVALSKDLRQRGFRFVGPTICYAHMQATGMVNDHSLDCFRRQEIIATYGQAENQRKRCNKEHNSQPKETL